MLEGMVARLKVLCSRFALEPSQRLLVELHAEELLVSRNGLEDTEVFLDLLEERGLAAVPKRLSWCSSIENDRYGLKAWIEIGQATLGMRYIPRGRFMMGSPIDEEGRRESEGPLHEESIEEGFWLADTPCTQLLWLIVVEKHPSRFQGRNHPVERVSWNDVQLFLSRLNSQLGDTQFAIPSEVEWEYACRAGCSLSRYGGIDAVAWYDGNSQSESHPVGQLAPNAFGIYDMLGNVSEWCSNLTNPYDGGVPVPSFEFRHELDRYAVRGGGWSSPSSFVRAASRSSANSSAFSPAIGFRIMRKVHRRTFL